MLQLGLLREALNEVNNFQGHDCSEMNDLEVELMNISAAVIDVVSNKPSANSTVNSGRDMIQYILAKSLDLKECMVFMGIIDCAIQRQSHNVATIIKMINHRL